MHIKEGVSASVDWRKMGNGIIIFAFPTNVVTEQRSEICGIVVLIDILKQGRKQVYRG